MRDCEQIASCVEVGRVAVINHLVLIWLSDGFLELRKISFVLKFRAFIKPYLNKDFSNTFIAETLRLKFY